MRLGTLSDRVSKRVQRRKQIQVPAMFFVSYSRRRGEEERWN